MQHYCLIAYEFAPTLSTIPSQGLFSFYYSLSKYFTKGATNGLQIQKTGKVHKRSINGIQMPTKQNAI